MISRSLRLLNTKSLARPVGVLQRNKNVAQFHSGISSSGIVSGRKAMSVSVGRITNARFMSVVTEDLESLGDSITTAVLLSWNKTAGEAVLEDDVIAVVETDKVTMDIRAKRSGVFVGGLVEEQAEIDPAAEAAAPAAAAPASSAAPVSVAVPIMGESITSGQLASWEANVGDSVEADQVVATIETDKVNVEVRSPESGVITEAFAVEGEEVSVG
eukprot:CAMPEP_0181343530 /NCGR_PEP_ID=MMETSP1101-20121128/31637_1 /TAXON_ID=46948 /ORGANISM="Rhodomonas abbreviata, Strain Caron Lab Isolate" /LENGTH=214 /DNA_ID=CAMNT_0023455169 /DNA_START=57 /DNA_END=697 /DNA_ORIENTATION=-